MCKENNNSNTVNTVYHFCDFCEKTEIVNCDDKDFEKKNNSWFVLRLKSLKHKEKKKELCNKCFYNYTPADAEDINAEEIDV